MDNGTGICAVRYPKGAQPALTASVLGENTDSWFLENRGGDTLLVTYGRLAEELFLARKSLEEQEECGAGAQPHLSYSGSSTGTDGALPADLLL
ncbi:MAG: hypothetical protein V8Q30_11330 [Acutalibacteraceae bacterium]